MSKKTVKTETLKPAVTATELASDLLNPFKNVLLKGGIDDKFLIRQLKSEFKSKEPKTIKVKGAINPDSLPRGYRIVATSGEIIHSQDGGQDYGDGETIIEYQVKNIGISQKARIDVHKLRGDYPAEKHELSGTVAITPQLTPEDRKLLLSTSKQVINDILQQHRAAIKPRS